MTYYIEPTIDRQKALKAMKQYTSSLLLRIVENKKRIESSELVYLPFWMYEYHLKTTSLKEGITGRIAIESISEQAAILPVDYPLKEGKVPGEMFTHCSPDPDKAKHALYWEAFGKEKKKKQINISLEEPSKLYLPYWVGYIKGNRREVYMVDGVTGKVDLPMKDSFLHHLKNQLKHSSI
ncbi:hypothetical protein [Pseudalkalibacillus sp. NRS-1564]|uniref:hypothetical protein n=1 Tax=Pseudalkalibacillus sp. NRS-1564 TaxID=3233900 RepID=UPI003D26CF47